MNIKTGTMIDGIFFTEGMTINIITNIENDKYFKKIYKPVEILSIDNNAIRFKSKDNDYIQLPWHDILKIYKLNQ